MNVLTIDCDWAIDDDKLLELLNFCYKKFNKDQEIIFVEEHHHVYNLINKGDILFNIDDHHDINYNNSVKFVIENNYCQQGNWIFALIYKKIITKYYWICNESSSYLQNDILELLKDLNVFVKSPYLNTIDKFNFEKIIVCKSEQYFHKANLTFKLIKNLCNNSNLPIKMYVVDNPNAPVYIC
jgi:hypothetical protein